MRELHALAPHTRAPWQPPCNVLPPQEAKAVRKKLAAQEEAAAQLAQAKEAAEAAVAQMRQQLEAAQGQSGKTTQQAADIEAYKQQLSQALADLESERQERDQLKQEVRHWAGRGECIGPPGRRSRPAAGPAPCASWTTGALLALTGRLMDACAVLRRAACGCR